MKIKMKEYGSVLTGREFGKTVFTELRPKLVPPVILDFSEVASLGSSFGDEVVPAIARLQGDAVQIVNANHVVKEILKDVAEDGGIELQISR